MVFGFGATAAATTGHSPAESLGFTSAGATPTDDYQLVDFYAQSCGHCQRMAPAFAEAEQLVAAKATGAHVAFRKVECFGEKWEAGKDRALCEQVGVHGFPTVKLFSKQDVARLAKGDTAVSGVDYEGDRSAASLADFVAQNAGVGAKAAGAGAAGAAAVAAGSAAAAASAAGRATLTEFFGAACPHCQDIEPAWAAASAKLAKTSPGLKVEQKECADANWGPGKDAAECDRAGVPGYPTIRLTDSAGHTHEFNGERTADGIASWAAGLAKTAAKSADDAVGAGAASKVSVAQALTCGFAAAVSMRRRVTAQRQAAEFLSGC